MTLRIPSADVSLLDSYDRSLTSEGPELTRRPTFDGDIPPVEDTNAGLAEELPVPGTKQERTCRQCGKATIDYDVSIRCPSCCAFTRRLHKFFNKNKGLRKSWMDLSRSARKEWFKCRDAHIGLTGTDLAQSMALHIVNWAPPCTEMHPGFKELCLRASTELRRRSKGKEQQMKQVQSGATKVFDNRRRLLSKPRHRPIWTRPYYLKQKLGKLKAQLDKARAAADAAIAEDDYEVVPPVVRQLLLQKNDELETMKTEIDLVANGEHSSLDTAGAKRKTIELVTTCKNTLISFRRVRYAILMASDFE